MTRACIQILRGRKQACSLFVLILSIAGQGHAADHLLGPVSALDDVWISTDSQYVVTGLERLSDNANDLISIPIGGGAATVLTGPQVKNRKTLPTGFSDANNHVLFRAYNSNVFGIDLYTVPASGGDPIQLNESVPDTITQFFGVDPSTDLALFTQGGKLKSAASIGGATPTDLSGPLVSVYVDAKQFLAPKSAKIAFQARETHDGIWSVFSSSVEGGGTTALLSQMTPDGWLDIRGFLPDGSAALLDAQWDNQFNHRLVTVPLSGGQPSFVSDAVPRTDGSPFRHFAFTGDSTSVLYIADTRRNGRPAADVFIAPAAGGAPTKLTIDLDPSLTVSIDKFDSLLVSDATNRAVFICREFHSSNVQQLYSAGLDGGPLIALTPNTLDGEIFTVNSRTYRLAPGGNYVAFQARQGSDQYGLYIVPVGGGEIRKLSEDEPVDSFLFDGDGALVYYSAGHDVFRSPLLGGEHLRMNETSQAGTVGAATVLSPDGSRLVYSTFNEFNSTKQLWSVDALVSLSGDTDFDGKVDLEDLNNVRNSFGETGAYLIGDTAPFDGIVDLNDLNRVRNDFGAQTETHTVPQPASGGLLGIGLAGLLLLKSARLRKFGLDTFAKSSSELAEIKLNASGHIFLTQPIVKREPAS